MSTSEYAPQYYVRIFPAVISSGENATLKSWEFEINPEVLSISTDKDIDNPSGSWSIEINYKGSGFGDNDWFMKISPMDYVEIFARRENVYADVIDIDPTSQTYKKIIKNKVEVPFGKFDLKDSNKPLTYHNNDNIVFKEQFGAKDNSGNIKSPTPLTITEKVASPDLLMCGFIDQIENKFSLGQAGPQNKLVISGRDVAKFLQEHQVFFKYIDQTFLAQMSLAQECIPTLKAADVLNFILVLYLQLWLEGIKDSITTAAKEKVDWTVNSDVAKITFFEDKNLKDHPEITKIVRLDKTSYSRFIYWDIAERNSSSVWARIEDRSPTVIRSASPFVEGPLWSILKQQVAPEQNELWVDETGNLVFRKYIDAWTQPDVETYQENYYSTGDAIPLPRLIIRPNDRPWKKITESEIINWNLKKSDNNLKTLVTVQSSTNIKYGQSTLDEKMGQVPLTEDVLNRAINLLGLNGASKSQIEALQTMYLKNIDTFDLLAKDGIRRFWNKYGVRPITVLDQYSDTLPEFFENALTMFEKFANLWWTGTLTVKGDPSYKVGRILYLQDLDLTFYITGVSHRFIWGESWTTTLKLVRGSKRKDITDHRLFFKTQSVSSTNIVENMYTKPSGVGEKMQLKMGNEIKLPMR